MDPGFPDSQTSIIDRGTALVGGYVYHRISVEEPLLPTSSPNASSPVTLVDFYFDPSSHLLAKSVQFTQIAPLDRERYIDVVSYSHYRSVNTLRLPATFTETLNGQTQWTLTLTTIAVAPEVTASYF